MNAGTNPPFDQSLPSPLRTLVALRSSGEESVVATSTISETQEAMYVATSLEERLAAVMASPEAPSLLLLSGSAGGGKSALIRKLERTVPESTFSHVIEDATHAEAPNGNQMKTLAESLSGFRDGVPSAGQRILLAANTGLLLRMERSFQKSGEANLAELVAYALHCLGVTALAPMSNEREAELQRSVLVVDLDQRPTSGSNERLLVSMLAVLDPDSPKGIFKGAARCRTCKVRAYCAPRTNLELLSDPLTGAIIDDAVEQVAMRRGRDIPPRLLWDGLAELALGGIEVPDGADPCEAIVAMAAADDHDAVWSALLSNGALASGGTSQLCQELSPLDPTYQPDLEAHDIIATAGVDPEGDYQLLITLLAPPATARHAVRTAAQALRKERNPGDAAYMSRGLVRASWLAGKLPIASGISPDFIGALHDDTEAVERVLHTVSNGLVRAFGRHAEGSDYLPTENLAETRRARVLVKVEVVGELDLEPPLPLQVNPRGSEIVGVRPLSARLKISSTALNLDLALFELLEKASEGSLAASLDIERFHALRHAVEILGRSAADNPDLPLLIERFGDNSIYRASMVPWRGERKLRIAKVG
jgi:hypothetical protein